MFAVLSLVASLATFPLVWAVAPKGFDIGALCCDVYGLATAKGLVAGAF